MPTRAKAMVPLRITGRARMAHTACTAVRLIVSLRVRVATAHLAHAIIPRLHIAAWLVVALLFCITAARKAQGHVTVALQPHVLQVHVATAHLRHALQALVAIVHLRHALQARVAARPLRLHITAVALRALVITAITMAIMATVRARARITAALTASIAIRIGVTEHSLCFPQANCSFPFVSIKCRGDFACVLCEHSASLLRNDKLWQWEHRRSIRIIM